MSAVRLVPTESVRPSTYNPRQADEARLAVVELSLRKLGWLLPIYATPDGEIISGHQRHLVAQRMGLEHVPVETVGAMDLAERKAVNVVFNRATNDLEKTDTTRTVTHRLASCDLEALADQVADKRPGSDEFAPCLRTEPVAIADLIAANRGAWNDHARNVAASLYRRGIVMPVVLAPGLRVVNGIGRVQLLAEKGQTHAQAVTLGEAEAALALPLLNWLSMDFDLHTRYADLLRHNSFRRARRQRRRDRRQGHVAGGRAGAGDGALERGTADRGGVRARGLLLALDELRGLAGGEVTWLRALTR